VFYLYYAGKEADEAAVKVRGLGGRATVVAPPPFVSEEMLEFKRAAGGSLTIEGPSVLTVGIPAVFTATGADGKPIKVTWSAHDTAGVNFSATEGEKTEVTVDRPLTFAIVGTPDSGQAETKQLTAVGASSDSPSFSSYASGYGSVVISVVLIAAATALGILNVLTGESLATLFGAIAGYIFFKAASPSSGGASTSSSGQTAPAGGGSPQTGAGSGSTASH
jgi:hypothetical protein